ncbi:MAG: hypothetical protein ACI9LF_001594, partial [Flavobacteriales bacterium]
GFFYGFILEKYIGFLLFGLLGMIYFPKSISFKE